MPPSRRKSAMCYAHTATQTHVCSGLRLILWGLQDTEPIASSAQTPTPPVSSRNASSLCSTRRKGWVERERALLCGLLRSSKIECFVYPCECACRLSCPCQTPSVRRSNFQVGEKVECQFRDGVWYEAVVNELRADGSVLVTWYAFPKSVSEREQFQHAE